tara:strand:+ start:51 stop:350 length:300 start_codon:yes stop_codon:yes gene_type:complete
MAQHCVEIPDEHLDRVMNAVAAQYGYNSTINNPDFDSEQPENEGNLEEIVNPITIGQFVNQTVRDFLINNVKAHESKQASETARLAAIEAVDVAITDPS